MDEIEIRMRCVEVIGRIYASRESRGMVDPIELEATWISIAAKRLTSYVKLNLIDDSTYTKRIK